MRDIQKVDRGRRQHSDTEQGPKSTKSHGLAGKRFSPETNQGPRDSSNTSVPDAQNREAGSANHRHSCQYIIKHARRVPWTRAIASHVVL